RCWTRVSRSPPFLSPAEDGIRDRNVTGGQTCALPISGVFREAVPARTQLPALRVVDVPWLCCLCNHTSPCCWPDVLGCADSPTAPLAVGGPADTTPRGAVG